MEEFYYYWSMWFLWVLTTFILEKNSFRFYASAFILLNIMLSMYQIQLFLHFNAAYLSFYIGAFMLCGYLRLHKSVKRLLLHLSMVSAYGFLFLFALYDPVWFILKPEWLTIILFVIMTTAFERSFAARLGMFVLGACQGSSCIHSSSESFMETLQPAVIHGCQCALRGSFSFTESPSMNG